VFPWGLRSRAQQAGAPTAEKFNRRSLRKKWALTPTESIAEAAPADSAFASYAARLTPAVLSFFLAIGDLSRKRASRRDDDEPPNSVLDGTLGCSHSAPYQ
jgi:hypothetical protein